MRGDPVDLRPLTLAELLDRAFSTYKQHLWLFVGIMAVPAVWSTGSAVVLEAFKGLAPAGHPEQIVLRAGFILTLLVLQIIGLFANAFALGAATVAVSQLYQDRQTSVGESYRAVMPYGGQLVMLLLWCGLLLALMFLGLIVLGGVLGILAGLFLGLIFGRAGAAVAGGLVALIGFAGAFGLMGYFGTRWGVSVPAVVLERLSARASLKRSAQLTEDNRGRVFLVILCAVVITYATVLLFQMPFIAGAMFAGPGTRLAVILGITGAVIGGTASMFSGPIMIIGLAMMYYDLRIRKEALDLQLMLESLDAPPGS